MNFPTTIYSYLYLSGDSFSLHLIIMKTYMDMCLKHYSKPLNSKKMSFNFLSLKFTRLVKVRLKMSNFGFQNYDLWGRKYIGNT